MEFMDGRSLHDLFPDGWLKLADGKDFLKVRTRYGIIMLALDQKSLDEIVDEAAFFSVAEMTDLPQTFDDVERMTGLQPVEDSDVIIDIDDKDFTKEVQTVARETASYIRAKLPEMLDEAVWSFIQESLLAAVFKRIDAGFFNFKVTELDAFRKLTTEQVNNLRERMNISKSSGAELYWSDDMKLELLDVYEKLLPMTRAAKQSYRRLRDVEGWKRIIAEEYPELPKKIIEGLPKTGKDGEPNFLVLTYASSLFDEASVSYMVKKISEAKALREPQK